MRIRYLKAKRWLAVAAGGLLGINVGCSDSGAELMYGLPTGIYRVRGTVVDQHGEPAAGIGVGSRRDYGYGQEPYIEAGVTDDDGRFDIEAPTSGSGLNLVVELKDADGEANGLFADTSGMVGFSRSDLHGGNGKWNLGTATKEVTFEMRKIE